MGIWIPSALFAFILHSKSGVLTIPQLLHGTIALDKSASKACYVLLNPHPQVDYNMVWNHRLNSGSNVTRMKNGCTDWGFFISTSYYHDPNG